MYTQAGATSLARVRENQDAEVNAENLVKLRGFSGNNQLEPTPASLIQEQKKEIQIWAVNMNEHIPSEAKKIKGLLTIAKEATYIHEHFQDLTTTLVKQTTKSFVDNSLIHYKISKMNLLDVNSLLLEGQHGSKSINIYFNERINASQQERQAIKKNGLDQKDYDYLLIAKLCGFYGQFNILIELSLLKEAKSPELKNDTTVPKLRLSEMMNIKTVDMFNQKQQELIALLDKETKNSKKASAKELAEQQIIILQQFIEPLNNHLSKRIHLYEIHDKDKNKTDNLMRLTPAKIEEAYHQGFAIRKLVDSHHFSLIPYICPEVIVLQYIPKAQALRKIGHICRLLGVSILEIDTGKNLLMYAKTAYRQSARYFSAETERVKASYPNDSKPLLIRSEIFQEMKTQIILLETCLESYKNTYWYNDVNQYTQAERSWIHYGYETGEMDRSAYESKLVKYDAEYNTQKNNEIAAAESKRANKAMEETAKAKKKARAEFEARLKAEGRENIEKNRATAARERANNEAAARVRLESERDAGNERIRKLEAKLAAYIPREAKSPAASLIQETNISNSSFIISIPATASLSLPLLGHFKGTPEVNTSIAINHSQNIEASTSYNPSENN